MRESRSGTSRRDRGDRGDPLDLGNLYREKASWAAIQTPGLCSAELRKLEQAACCCASARYKAAASSTGPSAFNACCASTPTPSRPSNLEKLYDEQYQWDDAYTTSQKLRRGRTEAKTAISASSDPEHELGRRRSSDIDRNSRAPSSKRRSSSMRQHAAQLNLGDCTAARQCRGRRGGMGRRWSARPIGLTSVRAVEDADPRIGDSSGFRAVPAVECGQSAEGVAARLALDRHSRAGTAARCARYAVRRAVQNQHALSLHRRSGRCWRAGAAGGVGASYIDVNRGRHFSWIRHRVRCRYRSTSCCAVPEVPRLNTASRRGSRRRGGGRVRDSPFWGLMRKGDCPPSRKGDCPLKIPLDFETLAIAAYVAANPLPVRITLGAADLISIGDWQRGGPARRPPTTRARDHRRTLLGRQAATTTPRTRDS